MKSIYLTALALTFLVTTGAACTTSTNTNSQSTSNDETMMTEGTTKDAITTDDAMMEDDTHMEAMAGAYVTYDANAVKAAAKNGTAILFFHAPWCPTCSALNKNIEANLEQIPDNVTIFKTDYDTYTDLKKQYGVTYQHTLVQVDAEGNQITKWSGGNTVDSIVSKIQ